MIQNIENYLKSLFSANVSVSGLEDALKLIKASSELKAVLNDPNVPAADKAKVAEELFVPSVKDFILQLSKQGNIDDLEEIINSYISNFLHSERRDRWFESCPFDYFLTTSSGRLFSGKITSLSKASQKPTSS